MSELVAPLWCSVVGSRAFGVNHAGSDYDLFACYAVDTAGILKGAVSPGGCHESVRRTADGTKVDYQSHELSRWVNGVRDGNLNYLLGVFSPIVVDDPYGKLAELRVLADLYRSTHIVHSVRGMAVSALRKAEGFNPKPLMISLRLLGFAQRYLSFRRLSDLFEKPRDLGTITFGELSTLVVDAVREMERVTSTSGLPLAAEARPFYDYSYRTRMEILHGELPTDRPLDGVTRLTGVP